MAVNPQSIWTAREFGMSHEFVPVPAGADGYAMDRIRFRLRGNPGGDHNHFSGPDQPIHEQAEQQGYGVGGDSGGTDRRTVGGTTEDLINEFRNYDAQKRESVAPEATGKVDVLDKFLHWLQGTFWFVRKEAYPEFDKIMYEAREFAKTPDATMVPLVLHPIRRTWADKVLTGEDDE